MCGRFAAPPDSVRPVDLNPDWVLAAERAATPPDRIEVGAGAAIHLESNPP